MAKLIVEELKFPKTYKPNSPHHDLLVSHGYTHIYSDDYTRSGTPTDHYKNGNANVSVGKNILMTDTDGFNTINAKYVKSHELEAALKAKHGKG